MRIALLALLGLAAPHVASAYENPRLLSLAGAESALAVGNDAFYRNPAGVALGNFYSIEVGYLDDFQGGDRQVSASITDGYDKPIAGGVGYVYQHKRLEERGDADLDSTLHRVDVALALKLMEGLAIGLQGRFLTSSHDIAGVSVAGSGFDELSFDAGIAYNSPVGLALSFVGTNLTDSAQPELPMGIGGGVGFTLDVFSIEADLRHDFLAKKPSFAVGASVLLGGTVALRAGGAYDLATESSAISVGIGVQNEKFGADLGFRQKLSGSVAPGLGTERMFGLSVRGMPFM